MAKQAVDELGGFTETEDEDTIELELSAEQALALSQAYAPNRPQPPNRPASLPVSSKGKSSSNASRDQHTPRDQRSEWAAVILSISAVSVLSGGIAYWATNPAEPVAPGANQKVFHPAAPGTMAPRIAEEPTPVRFTNPFDATEVFEFPSGTSETEARDAVADLLLQRAHDRRNSPSKIARQREKTADQGAGLQRRTRLAQRS